MSFRDGHAPAGTIEVGSTTVTEEGTVYVYHSLEDDTVVSSTVNTDKYSVDYGISYT